MDHAEIVSLIRAAVPHEPGIWADLGAGNGNFTAALRELLPSASRIYAVDRDRHAIREQNDRWRRANPGPSVVPIEGDITTPLSLPQLDGILLANVLHFVRDQAGTLRRLVALLKPAGRVVIIEYDLRVPRSYVPYPIPSSRFLAFVRDCGLIDPCFVGTRRSPTSGTVMYAGLAFRPYTDAD